MTKQLVAAYKAAYQYETDDEHLAADCETICNAILHVLHWVDYGAYLECVTWAVNLELPPGVTVEDRTDA